MGKAKTKTLGRSKKAKLEGAKAAAETKKAAQDTVRALRELSLALAEQVKSAGIDERAQELAERIMESDAMGRTQTKGRELSTLAREKLQEAGLDERAAELAARVRESAAGQQATERARQLSDETLERAGEWLTTSKAGEKLGVKKPRTFPMWIVALVGVAVGYAIGMLTAPKRGEELRADLTQRGGGLRDDLATAAERVTQDTADVSAPPAEGPLEDRVRTALGQDPRTSELPRLNVNVVEGTVFVRGSVPAGFDESRIRSVVSEVPGVKDVDLQVGAST